jgi:hypothetical protein
VAALSRRQLSRAAERIVDGAGHAGLSSWRDIVNRPPGVGMPGGNEDERISVAQ